MSSPALAARCAEPHASIDDLDRAIVNLAACINASTHDFLILVRRFDERAGWLLWSFENCADWLHYRCDISRSAAREKVRVAHAMKTLPVISMAFAKGELSYSKVRALTRADLYCSASKVARHAPPRKRAASTRMSRISFPCRTRLPQRYGPH